MKKSGERERERSVRVRSCKITTASFTPSNHTCNHTLLNQSGHETSLSHAFPVPFNYYYINVITFVATLRYVVTDTHRQTHLRYSNRLKTPFTFKAASSRATAPSFSSRRQRLALPSQSRNRSSFQPEIYAAHNRHTFQCLANPRTARPSHQRRRLRSVNVHARLPSLLLSCPLSSRA